MSEPAEPTISDTASDRFRPDIQAMRAFAALTVLGVHLWPNRLPGGFVGVDVFFVISGFLIVGNLVREVRETGRIQVGRFWSRRARRLLPAALTVLAAVAVAVFAWVPQTQWQQFFRDVIGSALYVENWLLAADTSDAFARLDPGSPVRQFWTLSVEEQFYVLIPIIMLIAILVVARHRRRAPRAILIAMVALSVASFAYATWATVQWPSASFFSTPARAWEFGVGAILAFAPTVRNRIIGSALFVGGALAVIASVFLLNNYLPFPLWMALWPVLGAGAMVVGGAALARPLAAAVGVRIVQTLGRASYSLYLWHWPLIVLVPYAISRPLGTPEKVAVVVASLVLAWLTMRFIEEPVRNSSRLLGGARRVPTIFAWGAAGMAVVTLIAGAGLIVVHQRTVVSTAAMKHALASDDPCIGAASVFDDCTPDAGPILPDPVAASDDRGVDPGCWSNVDETALRMCSFGPDDAAVRLFVVGDLHSGQFTAAYAKIAKATGWRIDEASRVDCSWTAAVQAKPTPHDVEICENWKAEVRAHLNNAAPYTAIVVTENQFGYLPQPGGTVDPWNLARDGLAAEWKPWIDKGVLIIALKDNPRMGSDVIACTAAHPDSADSRCSAVPGSAVSARDPLLEAAAGTGSRVIDFSDIYCPDRCLPVIGRVLVYRSPDQLTRTWVLTVAPLLQQRIERVLSDATATRG